jgi:MFS transporter, DHA1 family, inner membrane transport protein
MTTLEIPMEAVMANDALDLPRGRTIIHRPPLALLSLFLATFCIGTTEFVIAGLLPEISRDLAVTIPTAGYLVTAYALGVAVDGPLISMLTSRFPRKPMILLLMSIFVAGHLFGALATNYPMLMTARMVISFSHGSFFGLALVIAASLVSEAKRGRASALVFAGITVANVLGAPGGTAIGNALGWRATFWIIAGIACLSTLFMAHSLPKDTAGRGRPKLRDQVRALGRQMVLTSFLMMGLLTVAVFATFTYVAPSLIEVTQVAPDMIAWILLGFGVGATVGVFLGGRLADIAPGRTLIAGLLLQALVFLALFALNRSPLAMVIVLPIWGCVNFMSGQIMQARVLKGAAAAPELASTLISSVFNFGIAGGATLGAVALTSGVGYAQLPLIGAGIAIANAALATVVTQLDRRAGIVPSPVPGSS